MERLTRKTNKQLTLLTGASSNYGYMSYGCQLEEGNKLLKAALDKLDEYEDLEEQGRLLKLPCKVGDTVYVVGVLGCETVEEYKVIRVDYHSNLATARSEFYIEALLISDPRADIGFYDKEFGKNVFLTKSEAEAKLKELRGEENVQ